MRRGEVGGRQISALRSEEAWHVTVGERTKKADFMTIRFAAPRFAFDYHTVGNLRVDAPARSHWASQANFGLFDPPTVLLSIGRLHAACCARLSNMTTFNSGVRMRSKIITAIVVCWFIGAPAFSQQSRLATPSGSNAKAPSGKAKAPAKAAAVTTSKAAPPTATSGKSAGTSAAEPAKPATATPTKPATAKPATAKPATATPTKPATAKPAVATTPAATKTVAGKTTGEKLVVAKPATIARPTTVVATGKPSTPVTAPPSVPGGGKPTPDVAAIETARPAVLPPNTAPDVGKAVEGLATGALTPQQFTALLAGGDITGAELAAALAAGALPPGTELKPPEVVESKPTEALPPPTDFSLARAPLPAVTENALFKAWCWERVDRDQTDFQTYMEWVVVYYLNPVALAQTMNLRPAGQRVLFSWDLERELIGNPADLLLGAMQQGQIGQAGPFVSPWPENGIAFVRERMTNFINAYADAGGTMDAFILDYESDLWWGLRVASQGQPAIDAIESDPRFPALAAELGFDDLNLIQDDNPQYIRWNQVMGGHFDAALQTAFYEPVRARFPNAVVSNYRSFSCDAANPTPWCTGVPDLRTTAGFGTHDARPYYGLISSELADKKPDGTEHRVGSDAYAGLRLQVQHWRATDIASTRPMHAWVAGANNPPDEYPPQVARTLTNSPYYDEMIFQLGAGGCDTFLYWNPASWLPTHNPADWNRLDDQLRLDSCLRELNEVLSQTPGAVVPTSGPKFGDQVVATGRRVGDRMVWRFTFAPGVNSVVVTFTDGTTTTVTKEPNRAGAWLSYPATMTIKMNSTNTAPDMVIGPSA